MGEIIRPTLVIDKEICLQNIGRMAQKAVENQLRFRPHFKTHQSVEVGKWFKGFGVESITVSSVRMAEYFAVAGWKDITLAFPVNLREIHLINRLAANGSFNVVVENREAIEALSKKITNSLGVYIKIDTGYHRTGILSSRTSTIDAVIRKISSNPKTTFKGFLSHTGHTYQAKSTNEISNRHYDALLKLRSLKNRYKKDFSLVEISLGDTPSCSICTNFDEVDEIRPGNFVFYDLMQQSIGACKLGDIAVKMVCPVVSKHLARNEIVIFGGAVHFSKDSILNVDGKRMFGRVIIHKDGEKRLLDTKNYLAKISQEHGILKITPAEFKSFNVGDLVEILPVHSCLTADAMGFYETTDGEVIKMMPKV